MATPQAHSLASSMSRSLFASAATIGLAIKCVYSVWNDNRTLHSAFESGELAVTIAGYHPGVSAVK